MAEAGSSSDNMQKGKGLVGGFKTVGTGAKFDEDQTVDNEDKRGPGRPPKEDTPFTTVGKTAEEENGE